MSSLSLQLRLVLLFQHYLICWITFRAVLSATSQVASFATRQVCFMSQQQITPETHLSLVIIDNNVSIHRPSAGIYGGMRAAMQLRAMLGEIGCISVSNIFGIPQVNKALDEDGKPLDHHMEKWVTSSLKYTLYWTDLAMYAIPSMPVYGCTWFDVIWSLILVVVYEYCMCACFRGANTLLTQLGWMAEAMKAQRDSKGVPS